jgi:oligogalacturonide lyase
MRLAAADKLEGHFPSEASVYPDPATEFPVARLTSPSWNSHLTAALRSRNWLLYSSDRTGKPQLFRMDLKTGESDQLTHVEDLDPASVVPLADERGFCYFDGMLLRQTSFLNGRDREIYRLADGWLHGTGLSVSTDGRDAAFMERRAAVSRLRLLAIARGSATTVVETDAVQSDPALRPRRAGILYRRQKDAWWLVNHDGRDNHRLKLAAGGAGQAFWSADGRSVLYLNFPEDRHALNAIREHVPDSGADQLVSVTSQFASFSPNADASIFVGASGNRGSPHLLLLDRATRRELTLCEHRASNPASVAPQFSPDSQRVYFQSDQHGKPAIYSLRVDRLVTKTET